MATEKLDISCMDVAIRLFGNFDENIKVLAEEFNTQISLSEDKVIVSGNSDKVQLCAAVTQKLMELIEKGEHIDKSRIKYCAMLAREGRLAEMDVLAGQIVAISSRGKPIKSKTLGQKKYVEAIKKNTIVISTGPAGTGKTYLAVALAASAFKKKEVEKIILTRPAVEAGEKLGFLPGDLQTKVDPYLRPLYDALSDMFGQEAYIKLIEKQQIEVAPLAYMRGRTLSNSFIILDEAQNTTSEQMKMFLTRIGEGSKMVVNGDITQIDLPDGKTSGLKNAIEVLRDLKDIAIVNLTFRDVVRHELVSNIIRAYDKHVGKAKLEKKQYKSYCKINKNLVKGKHLTEQGDDSQQLGK